jgi:uncharacterized protein
VTVYSNTTPLLAFCALQRLDLLPALYGRLFLADTVVQECAAGGPILVPELKALPWIRVLQAPSAPDARFYTLDAGERDTLSLALTGKADLVLIDERLGRNLAEYHGLKVIGTLGTLVKAKREGLIASFIDEVRRLQSFGFWYHEPLVQRLSRLVGEGIPE